MARKMVASRQHGKNVQKRRKKDKATTLLPLLGVLCVVLGLFVVVLGLVLFQEDPRLMNWLMLGGVHIACGIIFFIGTWIARKMAEPRPIGRTKKKK